MTVLLIVLAVVVLALFVLFGLPSARRRRYGRRRGPHLGRGRFSGRWGRRI